MSEGNSDLVCGYDRDYEGLRFSILREINCIGYNMSCFVELKRIIMLWFVYFVIIVFDSGSKLCYKLVSVSLMFDCIVYYILLIVLGVRSVFGIKEMLYLLKMFGLGFVVGLFMFRELFWGWGVKDV